VPRPEGLERIAEHGRRRRHLGQGPAVGPPEPERAVGLSIHLVALLVDGAVVSATQQGEIRERGRAALRPMLDVMSLAEWEPAARKAATLIPVVQRAPQRGRDRPRSRPDF
jgi:hypothetical protein